MIDPDLRNAIRRARYSIEMKEALKQSNARLRAVCAIKKDRIRAGAFPFAFDEACEAATDLGYTPDSRSWCKTVSKLTRMTGSQVRRERMPEFVPDEPDELPQIDLAPDVLRIIEDAETDDYS